VVAFNKLAVRGVNGGARHLAVGRQQGQQVNQPAAAVAEPGAHHFGLFPAVFAHGLDGFGERDRPVAGDCGPLFGLGQAGMTRQLGMARQFGRRRPAGRKADQDENRKSEGDRHEAGDSGVPVNAG